MNRCAGSTELAGSLESDLQKGRYWQSSLGALCHYRFGQTSIWSEPGRRKIGAEEREQHVGENLVNSWREVRSQTPLV